MIKFFFITWITLFVIFLLLHRWAGKEIERRREQEAKAKEPINIHITITKHTSSELQPTAEDNAMKGNHEALSAQGSLEQESEKYSS